MLPIITVIVSPDLVESNKYIRGIYDLLNVQSQKEFVLYLCIGLVCVYLVKNIFLIFLQNFNIVFDYENRKGVSVRMMNGYLHRDYLFHVQTGVAELQRNVLSDVTSLFQVINCGIKLLIELLTIVFISVYLFVLDWVTTLIVVSVIATLLAGTQYIYKKMLIKFGMLSRESAAQVNKWVLQFFSGIKSTDDSLIICKKYAKWTQE